MNGQINNKKVSKTLVFGKKQKCSGYLYGNKYNNYEELCELCKWVRITPEDVLNNNGAGDIELKLMVEE